MPVVQTLHNYRLVCPNGYFLRDGKICEDCVGHSFPSPAVRHKCYRNSRLGSILMALLIWVHRKRKTWSEAVTRYIALTDFSRSRFVDTGALPAERVTVKPNFIDDSAIQAAEEDTPSDRYAIFVGRLWPEKGCDILVDAWNRLGEQDAIPENFRLILVGDGIERARLEVGVTNKRAQETIEFTGAIPRQQVFSLLKGAEFMAFPSIWYEGFPMTIVEAFACGTPILSSRIGNMQSIIRDGETGLFFEPGNPGDLADTLSRAMREPEDMSRMGREARSTFEQHYTRDRNYEALLTIYEDALADVS